MEPCYAALLMSGAGYDSGGTIRFGVFELDTRTGELRKRGVKLKLPHQAIACSCVAECSWRGRVQARVEGNRLAGGTFVDFDAAINKSMSQLRTLLGDTGPSPRFIERCLDGGIDSLLRCRAITNFNAL
jgi:hypothetical protein